MTAIVLWYDLPVWSLLLLFRTHVYCIFDVYKKGTDGYFYLDQLVCLKFRLFHMLLEMCRRSKIFWCFDFSVTCAFWIIPPKFRAILVCGCLPGGSKFSVDQNSSVVWHCRWDWRPFYVCDISSVSVFNDVFHPQSAADYGNCASADVAHFVYCLLQKIKQSSVLPLIEHWEVTRHLSFRSLLSLKRIVSLLVPACYQLLRKLEVPTWRKSSVETAGSFSMISWAVGCQLLPRGL